MHILPMIKHTHSTPTRRTPHTTHRARWAVSSSSQLAATTEKRRTKKNLERVFHNSFLIRVGSDWSNRRYLSFQYFIFYFLDLSLLAWFSNWLKRDRKWDKDNHQRQFQQITVSQIASCRCGTLSVIQHPSTWSQLPSPQPQRLTTVQVNVS